MCSFSWRDFGDYIAVAFNRDETIKRAKAIPPKHFKVEGMQYIMPIDPDAGGSWICVNQAGLVFALLNNYQGRTKAKNESLISRGEIVKSLALCNNFEHAQRIMKKLDLNKFQPFSLLLVSFKQKCMWEYDGTSTVMTVTDLPQHYFSSAHPEAERVLIERREVAENWPIHSDEDLLQLHRSHLPSRVQSELDDRRFSICMHHTKGHTQSLTYIKLQKSSAEVKYWNGQPCETNQYSLTHISIS